MTIIELISDITTVGGGQSLVTNLSISLSKNKDDKIYLISLYKYKESSFVKALKQNNIEVMFLGKKKGIDFKCARRLQNVIKDINPDVIHAHLNTIITIYLSKIFRKNKIVYTFHSTAKKPSSFADFVSNAILKKLMKKKKLIPVGISPIVKKTIIDIFKVTDCPVVMNGVDTTLFCPKKDFFERKYDFIIVGSFSPVKNQMSIIQLLHNIKMEGKDYVALFLGDGPLKKNCVEYVIDNGLEKNISFIGNVSNVNNYLRETVCLLMKSKYEGNPMVINEAISCGTFIISNNVGGIPDVVSEETGILVANEDDGAFKAALCNLLNNKELVLNNLMANIDHNRKRVSIDNTSSGYLNIFRNCIRKEDNYE